MADEDLEPQTTPQTAPITGRRDAWSAFRAPGRRLEALLVASATAVAYLSCLAVAEIVALVVDAIAVEPALKALAGRTLNSAVAQITEGAFEGMVVGVPVFFGSVWLMIRGLVRIQPVIDRWIERGES